MGASAADNPHSVKSQTEALEAQYQRPDGSLDMPGPGLPLVDVLRAHRNQGFALDYKGRTLVFCWCNWTSPPELKSHHAQDHWGLHLVHMMKEAEA